MPTPLRVLFVEDNQEDVELLRASLQRGDYEVIGERVEVDAEMQDALDRQEWDIILADHTLPDFCAAAALKITKNRGLDVPFIVVTGMVDEEAAVMTMRSGVGDYLSKHKLARLVPAVQRELREAQSRKLLRQAEQATRHMAAIVQASGEAIVSTKLDGIITSWNPAAERLYGWTAKEAVGQPIGLILPSEDFDALQENKAQLPHDACVDAFETTRLHKNGKPIDVSLTVSPIYDTAGAVIGISRIARDISGRKRAEAALRASEERFRAVVESDLIAIGFWTKEGAFVDGNNALLRITGHSREDLRAGRLRWRDITAEEHRQRDDQALKEIELHGRCQPYEKEFVRPDGSRVPVSLGAAWLPSQDLGVAYYLDITDQRRAEDALRRQTRILKSTLDSMGDGVVVADEHGKFLLFNPAAEKILSFGISDATPEQWSEQYQLYEPNGDTLFSTTELPLVRAAVDGAHVDQVEMYINHDRVPEGRWISVTARPMRDDAGALRGGVAVFRDISKQKTIEDHLARDALLLANVRDAVIVTDFTGLVTYWNDGATQLFGWTADEMLDRPLIHRLPESEQPRVREVMANILEQGEWSGEWLDYRKDGKRIWIESRVSRIANSRGQSSGIMGVSHDITPRKQAAEELHIRDRAIQAVSQGILITDPRQPDNPITFVNAGFERLTGYSAEEAVGKNCRFLQGPKSDPATVSQIRDAVQKGRSCTAQLINYRKDGTEFWNELSISPVTDAEGRVIHFVGVQNDVTTRRVLEDQLRQSQKMEAVGQLAGGVAHDFNNMLAVILGYSDALRTSTHLDADDKESVDEIHGAAQRAASLTRKLLAFSRKEVLEPKVLNLNSIITEMEKMLRRTIDEDIELKTNLLPTLWPVKVDPSQMEQVFLNLVVNARDAMPLGGSVTIETDNVEFTRSDPAKPAALLAGLYVKVIARDTGHGMDASTLARIFEPFFTTKEPGKGTGLGLAFIYGIVKQSNGHVVVDSALGKGTTFTIYLPSVRGAHQAHPENLSPADVVGGSETVLLVEDEDNVRKLLARTLRKLGYEVLEARNGLEAITIYQYIDTNIDLVVTDVVMPQMSGRVLIEQLRAINPKVKMFFISGYTDDAILRQGIMELDVHFLRKPFLPADFAVKVREVLDAQ